MPTNPRYRHGPIFDTQRKRCPVCHQPVYSLAGIHPQCAIKIAESSPPSPGVPDPAEADAGPPGIITLAVAVPGTPVKKRPPAP
jgi:hypothetical protein